VPFELIDRAVAINDGGAVPANVPNATDFDVGSPMRLDRIPLSGEVKAFKTRFKAERKRSAHTEQPDNGAASPYNYFTEARQTNRNRRRLEEAAAVVEVELQVRSQAGGGGVDDAGGGADGLYAGDGGITGGIPTSRLSLPSVSSSMSSGGDDNWIVTPNLPKSTHDDLDEIMSVHSSISFTDSNADDGIIDVQGASRLMAIASKRVQRPTGQGGNAQPPLTRLMAMRPTRAAILSVKRKEAQAERQHKRTTHTASRLTSMSSQGSHPSPEKTSSGNGSPPNRNSVAASSTESDDGDDPLPPPPPMHANSVQDNHLDNDLGADTIADVMRKAGGASPLLDCTGMGSDAVADVDADGGPDSVLARQESEHVQAQMALIGVFGAQFGAVFYARRQCSRMRSDPPCAVPLKLTNVQSNILPLECLISYQLLLLCRHNTHRLSAVDAGHTDDHNIGDGEEISTIKKLLKTNTLTGNNSSSGVKRRKTGQQLALASMLLAKKQEEEQGQGHEDGAGYSATQRAGSRRSTQWEFNSPLAIRPRTVIIPESTYEGLGNLLTGVGEDGEGGGEGEGRLAAYGIDGGGGAGGADIDKDVGERGGADACTADEQLHRTTLYEPEGEGGMPPLPPARPQSAKMSTPAVMSPVGIHLMAELMGTLSKKRLSCTEFNGVDAPPQQTMGTSRLDEQRESEG
jgi:hypothetical protein